MSYSYSQTREGKQEEADGCLYDSESIDTRSNGRYLLSTYYIPDTMLDSGELGEPSDSIHSINCYLVCGTYCPSNIFETGSFYAGQTGWPPACDPLASVFLG